MGCINNRFGETCSMYSEGEEDVNLGVNDEGHCIVEDDDSPSDSCTYYESDGSDDEEESFE